ncbi:hypothetical protein LZC95_35840 [Pendulispora brunnea]|uniref:Outer membrane protein beta-barrel domain-containing protein n=1 Tax=Pendulispora brunnea TaxID=2905690 RepID=A0ABZ2JZA0_9BACT
MRALFARLAGVAALAGTLMASVGTAEAQEIQITGPLAGKPPVMDLRRYREGRFEIAPTVSFTLLDEYRRTIFVGGRLQYNIKDWLGIGVWAAYGVGSIATDLTDQIDQKAKPRGSPLTSSNVTPGAFQDQVGKLEWIAAPQLTLVPFRGKLAIFQKIFVDTDAYIHGGVAFVGLKERGDCGGGGGQPGCTEARSFDLASRTAIAPTFGLGLSFYMNKLMSLGFEYRAFPFSWNRGGFDSRGTGANGEFPDDKVNSEDRTFKFNQMISIALGFHFPTSPKIR